MKYVSLFWGIAQVIFITIFGTFKAEEKNI